jgi:Immunity protein 22
MAIKDAHIWVARFESQEALDEYMDEAIDAGNDDAPISRFAADQGEGFYDHDLVYAEFLKSTTPKALIECWGFSDKATEAVVAAVEALGVDGLNTSFVADMGEFSKPKSASGTGYQLWYVGQFEECSQ